MNSMIQPVSGLTAGAAQSPGAVSGVKAPPNGQRAEEAAPARPVKPARDEYIPEEKQEPAGRYWLGKDEDGRPKIYFDDPERPESADGPAEKAADGPKSNAADGKKAETCTGNTDRVDREIRQLKKEKEKLEQQIHSEPDEAKRKGLEAKLANVERELRQKDNDAYRRQHTVFS